MEAKFKPNQNVKIINYNSFFNGTVGTIKKSYANPLYNPSPFYTVDIQNVKLNQSFYSNSFHINENNLEAI